VNLKRLIVRVLHTSRPGVLQVAGIHPVAVENILQYEARRRVLLLKRCK
jgi:hypothetical protein